MEHPVLQYAIPNVRMAPEWCRRAAFCCAVIPASIALICLAGYYATSFAVFATVGVIDLAAGGVAVFVGITLCVNYLAQAHKATVDRAGSIRRGRFAGILLLLNVPLAIVCSIFGLSMQMDPPVNFVIRNSGSHVITNVTMALHGQYHDTGPVAPGQSVTIRSRPDAPNGIWVTATIAGRTVSTQVIPFADSDSIRPDHPAEIIIDDNGAGTMNY